jgi:hypothetical protein
MGGGLDAHYMAQRHKDMPMSMINREANIRRGQGMMYNPYSGTYQRDSMYNRSGFGYGREPETGMGQPQAPAMTEPQMEWARKAQEKQTGAGALGKMGDKMAGINFSFGVNPMFGAGMQAASAAMQGLQNAQQSPAQNPYLSARQQNIANAKAAGEFDTVRADYNKRNEGTGMVMDEEGNISRDPTIAAKNLAEEKAMMSDFNRGIQRSSRDGVSSFTSPYGRGSVTTFANPSQKPQSMVRDDFGNMVPMRPFLERKNYVQGTQGMTGGTSVLGGNRPAASVLPANPLRKDEGRNLFPNAIDEKAQFDDFRGKLAEAKKRGEEGMAKARGGKTVAEQKPMTPKDMERLNFLEAKYGELGTASDEMKALDAARSAMTKERGELYQDIQRKKRDVLLEDPESGLPSYSISFNAKELAEKNKRLEELEPLIKENYKKSQEIGNKRKIPEDVMKEWLELSSRANAR